MGLLDKFFGNKVDYPPLPAGNAAMATLDEIKAPLAELAHKVSDHLEVVPAEHEAFVFLGKPPKKFGIAWIHDGKVTGLKEFAEEHHLSQLEIGKLIVRLRENNVKVLSRELKATQDRFSVGEVTRTDVAQAEARRAGSVSALDLARANLKTSFATYQRVIGHMPSALVAPPKPPRR